MIKVGLYDDELEAVKAFGVKKARELRKEHAANGHVKHEHKHTGSLCKLNSPTPEEQAQYDAAVAALAKKNICNAGDAAVWGDLMQMVLRVLQQRFVDTIAKMLRWWSRVA